MQGKQKLTCKLVKLRNHTLGEISIVISCSEKVLISSRNWIYYVIRIATRTVDSIRALTLCVAPILLFTHLFKPQKNWDKIQTTFSVSFTWLSTTAQELYELPSYYLENESGKDILTFAYFWKLWIKYMIYKPVFDFFTNDFQ